VTVECAGWDFSTVPPSTPFSEMPFLNQADRFRVARHPPRIAFLKILVESKSNFLQADLWTGIISG